MSESSPPPNRTRRWPIRIVLALLAMAGIGIAAAALLDQFNLHRLSAACRHRDPAIRSKALYRLGQEHEKRAGEVISEVLKSEQDRGVLESAGYAAMRSEDPALLDSLRCRADEGPDDPTRARLIIYAARLANRDVRLIPWLRQGCQAEQEPWRQAGSAVGLLELGAPSGGLALLALAHQSDHPAQSMALDELQRLAGLMAEAVGWPIRWPENGSTPDEAFWVGLEQFWAQHGSATLLNDVLTRRYGHDPRVYELRRLIHAREKIAQWFD